MEKYELVIDTRKNEKQKQALKILLDPKSPIRELWYGGARWWAKTFTGVARQWLMRHMYPGTRWFFARNELKKIKESTYISYLEFCEAYDIPEQYRWKFSEKGSKIVFKNWSEILFIDLWWKPSDPLYLRVGSLLFTDWFIEESNEIHPKGIEMIKTRVGRRKNTNYKLPARTLETFNPDKGHVYSDYWLPFKEWKELPYRKFIRALVTDNKYLSQDYIASLYNKSKITRERLLEWNFDYDDSPWKMFWFDELHDMKTNPIFNGIKYIVCDPARKWRDTAVITVWNGFEIIDHKVYAISTNDILEEKIKEFAQRYEIPMRNVIVDEDGVWWGIVDHLKCKGFVNNSSPIDTRTPMQIREDKPKPNYQNLKTQCYFYLADMVNQSKINISNLPENYREDLIFELDHISEEEIDKDWKKKITSKDKMKQDIGRSPDWADNFAMRMYFELAPQKKKAVAF